MQSIAQRFSLVKIRVICLGIKELAQRDKNESQRKVFGVCKFDEKSLQIWKIFAVNL